jgi:hypothetical protein
MPNTQANLARGLLVREARGETVDRLRVEERLPAAPRGRTCRSNFDAVGQ